MYVDTETISVEEYFPESKKLVDNYKKCQLQDQSRNIGLYLVTYIQTIVN